MTTDVQLQTATPGEKQAALLVRSLYEITVKEIKDPVLRELLALGVLFIALGSLSLMLQFDIPASVIWPLFLLGVVATLSGLVKWVIGVVSENGKEKALGQMRRLLRPAKTIKGRDLVLEMGHMIRESSDDEFIVDVAQRLALNALRQTGTRVKLPDLPRLYQMDTISPSQLQQVRQIVQAVLDEVSWKRHRVYVERHTEEQILQYPSTMLLAEEIYGGCSDKVVLLCTLLRALKFRARFKWAMSEPEHWAHAWVEVFLPTEQGCWKWVSLDPSVPGFRVDENGAWKQFWNKHLVPRGFPSAEYAHNYECS